MITMSLLVEEIINHKKKPHEKIRKTAIGQRDDYTTDCLIDYHYSKIN